MRLNACLTYVSRLEQIYIELTDFHMEAHGTTCGSYLVCEKSRMTLRYDAQKAINHRRNGQACKKKFLACKKNRTGLGTATLVLAKL